MAEWSGGSHELEAEVLGDDEFNGNTYTLLQLGDFDAADIVGLHGWFDFSVEDQVGFAGAEIFWTNQDKADTDPDGIFVMDELIYMFISDTLNDPQTDTGSGTWTIWGDETDFYVELTSETIALDVTVDVPYGTVEHCKQVNITAHQEFGMWPDSDGTATLYFHPELGLVKESGAKIMGFGLELKDIFAE